jgi:hypothetical protein
MTILDATPSRPASGVLDAFNVNLIAMLVALVLTGVGVKLSSFLPSKYYFSFSKFVDTDNSTSPFLINTPPYLAEDDICKALERNPSLKQITCKKEGDKEGDKDEASHEDEAYTKEIKLADRAIREQAQAQDSLSNIIGFGIRLLIPALAGFIVVRTFGPSHELAAAAGAAAAAIMLCWPVIVLWKLVVTEDFQEMFGQFLLLYMLGAVSFFYMAKIGAVFGRILADAKIFDLRKVLQDSSAKIIEPALVTIIASVGSKVLENLVLKS